jgi:hypothetical protein
MSIVRLWPLAVLACGILGWSSLGASAQPTGLVPQRDCHVLLTCRYTAGGIYRGCLSSYSCRVCRLVTTHCHIDPRSRVCQQIRCTWG